MEVYLNASTMPGSCKQGRAHAPVWPTPLRPAPWSVSCSATMQAGSAVGNLMARLARRVRYLGQPFCVHTP